MFTVADQIAQILKDCGVEVMFSQSLPSRLVLACEDIGIRQVVYRTENAGGAAADGYARTANKIGVVCAQNGPAATLLVPPLAEAFKASTPVIALVQEVERSNTDRNAFQELDHPALFSSCTKWCATVRERSRVEDYVRQAVIRATSGRPGPVALMLPADLLLEEAVAPSPWQSPTLGRFPLDRPVASPQDIETAAALLAQAEHPVVIAGGGVHGSGAIAELAALQEKASLPVGTTTMGKGAADERHPLSIGTVGNAMGAYSIGQFTKPMIQRADVVLLIGTRTNQNGTDSWSLLPPGAKVIHLDIDGVEVGRNYASLRLVGDAKPTLAALTAALSVAGLGKRSDQRPALEQEIAGHWQARDAAVEGRINSTATPIRPERIMRDVAAAVGDRPVCYVADASYASVWITTYLAARHPGARFLTPRGIAGLGWGLPMAIGAQLARPDDPVVCVVGDGGFGHVWSEVETLMREKLPIILIVLNNGTLGFQRDAEMVKFARHTNAVHFGQVDHSKVAEAVGCRGLRVSDPARLEPEIRSCLQSGEPALIDVVTDRDAYPPLAAFEPLLEERRAEQKG